MKQPGAVEGALKTLTTNEWYLTFHDYGANSQPSQALLKSTSELVRECLAIVGDTASLKVYVQHFLPTSSRITIKHTS